MEARKENSLGGDYTQQPNDGSDDFVVTCVPLLNITGRDRRKGKALLYIAVLPTKPVEILLAEC